MSGSAAPAGFRRSVTSGLILPEPVSRERKVITWDEWRTIERATKILAKHGIGFFWECLTPQCRKKPIERFRTQEGGIGFRCEHAERVVVKSC